MRSLWSAALCALALLGSAGTAGAAIGYAPDRAAEKAALGQIGVPYAYGGASPATGFDTSGLVVWAYAQEGIRLPHSSEALFALARGKPVARNDLRPGDLVFFNGASHVGIYVGGGRFVHAPQTGATVAIARLSGYYAKALTGAIRIGALG